MQWRFNMLKNTKKVAVANALQLEDTRHRASRSGLFFAKFVLLMYIQTAIFQVPIKILTSPVDSANLVY